MVAPFGALLGLILYYIKYNCSKSTVHLILGINVGFWAIQQLFSQNYCYVMLFLK